MQTLRRAMTKPEPAKRSRSFPDSKPGRSTLTSQGGITFFTSGFPLWLVPGIPGAFLVATFLICGMILCGYMGADNQVREQPRTARPVHLILVGYSRNFCVFKDNKHHKKMGTFISSSLHQTVVDTPVNISQDVMTTTCRTYFR